MIEAGILDGDYFVVRQQPAADSGNIIVALVEKDATVKKFFRRGQKISLGPANRREMNGLTACTRSRRTGALSGSAWRRRRKTSRSR